MVLSPSELAIARSVIYASLFDYPLTIDQLRETLLESHQSVSEMLGTFASSDALQAIIECRDGFFFQAGRECLVAERRRREARSRAFIERHRLFLTLVCALPYTRLVALSGSIAHLNLEGDGDLDLFIITRGRHVWSVTVAVVLLAKLMRCRRIVCANFVVADSRLSLEQQDLFTANQAIHLRPLVEEGLFREFLAANPFVGRFYPNHRGGGTGAAELGRTALLDRVKATVETLLSVPSRIVEAMCRHAYGWHLRRRAGSWRSPDQVRLEPDALKLHTRSHRQSTLERFDGTVREALQQAEAASVTRLAATRR